jgi:polyhydroxybutyrate depolymerase
MDINAGEEAWLFSQNRIDNTLSVINFEDLKNTIRVFPNPTSNAVNIEPNGSFEIKEMVLYNALGERIRLKTTNKLIDLTNLNTGIYLLRIKTSNETITKKIVKN